ncbi:hypothetical protein EK21DRAFT_94053 [Setomelanomma holmii]|uniref:Uncharacterized protein n=1 Tax=Setomelanomma holmii TaxID=210430 RepID=A0A9P4GZU2_9PLEO|nr:hypothetical protein EK21DRAFT_94053 [Setomelanomma holmii]
MGNQKSKPDELNSKSIEAWYTAQAAESRAILAPIAAARTKAESTALLHEWRRITTSNSGNGVEEEDIDNGDYTDASEAEHHPQADDGNQRLSTSLSDLRVSENIRNIPASSNAIEAATIHLKIAVRAMMMSAHDALDLAIAALKKIDAFEVMKAALKWMKHHPWETAAIIIPLVILACTPAFLSLAGFTATGVAAGSIAAGIQAGIGGSVAAGSVFATLTSAAMAGYGVPIVFGSVWGISSAVCWGIAAWKRWRGCMNDGNGNKDGDDKVAERNTRKIKEY